MSRPRIGLEKVAPPHRRLTDASRYEMAGVMALSGDGRLNHLELKTKLKIARKALDHLVDGDTPPAWLFEKGKGERGGAGTCLSQGFQAAVDAIRAAGAHPRMDHDRFEDDQVEDGGG
jgi:hypothetical protein